MLVHRERRMAIIIAAYAASSTKGANHDILSLKKDVKSFKRKRKPQRWRPLGFSAYKNRHGFCNVKGERKMFVFRWAADFVVEV